MYYEAASHITSVQGPILTSTATVGGSITCHIDVCCMRGVNRTTLARLLFITYRTANGLY